MSSGTNAGKNTSKRTVKCGFGIDNGAGGVESSNVDDGSAPVDERLRNIEPRMIEMINNEVRKDEEGHRVAAANVVYII